jgi:Pyruvate/2-oxoacid:ferredoxin oxidoreductase delta subunit
MRNCWDDNRLKAPNCWLFVAEEGTRQSHKLKQLFAMQKCEIFGFCVAHCLNFVISQAAAEAG